MMHSVGEQRKNTSTFSLTQLTQNKSTWIFTASLNPKNSMPYSTFWKVTMFWKFLYCNISSNCFFLDSQYCHHRTFFILFMDNYMSTWLVCYPQSPIVIYLTYASRSILLSSCHFSAQNPLVTHSPNLIPHLQENVFTSRRIHSNFCPITTLYLKIITLVGGKEPDLAKSSQHYTKDMILALQEESDNFHKSNSV